MAAAGAAGSRRGSGFQLNSLQGVSGYGTPRAPLVTTKSNSLSLPDSPTIVGQTRGRSNSLRVKRNRTYRYIQMLAMFFFFILD